MAEERSPLGAYDPGPDPGAAVQRRRLLYTDKPSPRRAAPATRPSLTTPSKGQERQVFDRLLTGMLVSHQKGQREREIQRESEAHQADSARTRKKSA